MPDLDVLQAAIARAIMFFADTVEPQALLWLERMHQRFGIADFCGSLRRFDELLADQREQAPKLRLLRRIADPGNELLLADLDSVAHTSDRIIVAALYCDRLDPPPFYPAVLAEAVQKGGYFCTHALLAWVWAQEFGGQLAVPAGFVDQLFGANAAIVNEDTSAVTDLKLEAAAFLYLAGQGALVDPAFVKAVVRTQNTDGGWGMTRAGPGISDWHGTVLGLLLLLQAQSSG